MKRKLAPWEEERKVKREMFIRTPKKKTTKSKQEAEREIADFCCPECGNDKRVDLICLRQCFYECRCCGHSFDDSEAFSTDHFSMGADEIENP